MKAPLKNVTLKIESYNAGTAVASERVYQFGERYSADRNVPRVIMQAVNDLVSMMDGQETEAQVKEKILSGESSINDGRKALGLDPFAAIGQEIESVCSSLENHRKFQIYPRPLSNKQR